MIKLLRTVYFSLQRCKGWIISVFITYCLACLLGIIMVHTGNRFALSFRDKIVGDAVKTSKASINYNKGNGYSAALFDFGGNLFNSVIQSGLGLGVVIPYVSVTYQGWIGGIVSVDYNHRSRFNKVKSALYYLIVLMLQFIPYSLAIGAGIRLGVATYKLNINRRILNYKIDMVSLKDVLRIYLLVIPMFLIASGFEFLSNWNI